LAQSNLNTESSLSANIQIAKLASSSLNAGSTLSADALVTRLFEASLNGNGSLFANPLITKFAASSLNANASLTASALVSKLAASSLTGAGTLVANLTVTSSIVYDADAQAFFNRVTTAGGILSATEQNAVNTLVIALKADGIWTKMKAIYPMVGASAAACSRNLKSDNFNGTFSSGWTFATTGVQPNGTSAFLNTALQPSSQLTTTSTHVSYYSRTDTIINPGIEIGTWLSSYSRGIELTLHRSNAAIKTSSVINSPGNSPWPVLGGSQVSSGFFISSRIASNLLTLFKNSTSLGTNTNSPTLGLSTFNIYIAASNDFGTAGSFSNKECAFASIGDGLTNTETANFYTRVQAFQTTLNRQINP
jgi:hypothetical protein